MRRVSLEDRSGTRVVQPAIDPKLNPQAERSEPMSKMTAKMFRRLKEQSGQSLVEYALILALISVVAILVLRGIGTNINNKLASVNSNLK